MEMTKPQETCKAQVARMPTEKYLITFRLMVPQEHLQFLNSGMIERIFQIFTFL